MEAVGGATPSRSNPAEHTHPEDPGKGRKLHTRKEQCSRARFFHPGVKFVNQLPLDRRLLSVFEYIDAHLRRNTPITVLELSRLSNLSVPRFSHLFALGVGLTPGKFLRLCRAGSVRVEVLGALSREQHLEPDSGQIFITLHYSAVECECRCVRPCTAGDWRVLIPLVPTHS
jgi:AraC-like DNA-binding protein